ncbi:Imm41 family immunity protein [Xanthomonas sp. LMG 9002]|uniref:Imm41 family immunity protein n=1 Tax=Xanthomonas sp. LMG 9002 TaxID=1591158 RepID=UPI001369A271|nr:Imm41 family immunity protein [Xanthomonas sp. LMG 9002]
MNATNVVTRNLARCAAYDDGSFVGRLHEEMRWNWDEYWLLEKALYDLATDGELERETAWPLFRIFSFVLMLLGCHFDPNDLFAIKGVSDEDVRDLLERFQLVFEGFYAGRMPAYESLDPPNPLLASTHH